MITPMASVSAPSGEGRTGELREGSPTRTGAGTRDGAGAAAPAARRSPSPLRRYPDRGLLGGVCAGLAQHFGVEPRRVRVVMVIVMFVGGLGLALYALAWALIPVAPESAGLPRRPGAWREAVLIVLAVAAVLIAVRVSGLRLGNTVGWVVVWPFVLGACGLALVWRPTVPTGERVPPGARTSLRDHLRRASRIDGPRVAIGALLVVFASASLLHTFGVLHSLGAAIGAVVMITVVSALLLGPWVLGLGRSLASERAARIREQERAELAAHLHDSVLQTLALIQKRAADPREVAGLARRQERELRNWLLERPGGGGQETVAAALERAAAEVEELHRVPIEVVTVGDGPLEEGLDAIVQAAREAMTNAAKFARSDHVDLYAEVEPARVEVFVRDRGIGFDPGAIPDDRRGVRDSIIARMERHNGRAAVRSRLGEGTEVELAIGRGAAA